MFDRHAENNVGDGRVEPSGSWSWSFATVVCANGPLTSQCGCGSTPKGRWHRGHGLWVHDVLAFRGSPAAWQEGLLWVSGVTTRELTPRKPTGSAGSTSRWQSPSPWPTAPPPRRSGTATPRAAGRPVPAAQPGGGAGFLSFWRALRRSAGRPARLGLAGLPLLGVCGQASGSPPRCAAALWSSLTDGCTAPWQASVRERPGGRRGMHITHATRDGCLVVALTGKITLSTAPQIRRALLKDLAEQPLAVICDLGGVDTLDPICSRLFASVANHPVSRWPPTSLLLCGAQPAVAEVLGSFRVGHFLRSTTPSRRPSMRPSIGRDICARSCGWGRPRPRRWPLGDLSATPCSSGGGGRPIPMGS